MAHVRDVEGSKPTGVLSAFGPQVADTLEHDVAWRAVLRGFAVALVLLGVLTVSLSWTIERAFDVSGINPTSASGLPVLVGAFSAFLAFLIGGIVGRRSGHANPLAQGATMALLALGVSVILAMLELTTDFAFTEHLPGGGSNMAFVTDSSADALHVFALLIIPIVAFPAAALGSVLVPPKGEKLDRDPRAKEPQY